MSDRFFHENVTVRSWKISKNRARVARWIRHRHVPVSSLYLIRVTRCTISDDRHTCIKISSLYIEKRWTADEWVEDWHFTICIFHINPRTKQSYRLLRWYLKNISRLQCAIEIVQFRDEDCVHIWIVQSGLVKEDSVSPMEVDVDAEKMAAQNQFKQEAFEIDVLPMAAANDVPIKTVVEAQ